MIRSDAKEEILDCGILEICIKHIELYPDDDVDLDVLVLSLDIIS
jgi:hypothetical protein